MGAPSPTSWPSASDNAPRSCRGGTSATSPKTAVAVALAALVVLAFMYASNQIMRSELAATQRITLGHELAGRARDYTELNPSLALRLSSEAFQRLPAKIANNILLRAILACREQASFNHPGGITTAAYLPGDSRIATGSFDGTLRIFDLETRTLERVWRGHERSITALAVHPETEVLASASQDGTARLYALNDPQQAQDFFEDAGAPLLQAAFCPKGDAVLTLSEQGALTILEAATGRRISHITGRWRAFVCPPPGPAATTTVALAESGEIGFIELADRCLKKSIQGHDATVLGAAFRADGRRLITWSADRTCRQWDLSSLEELTLLSFENDIEQAAAVQRRRQKGHSSSTPPAAVEPFTFLAELTDGSIVLMRCDRGRHPEPKIVDRFDETAPVAIDDCHRIIIHSGKKSSASPVLRNPFRPYLPLDPRPEAAQHEHDLQTQRARHRLGSMAPATEDRLSVPPSGTRGEMTAPISATGG